MDFAQFKNYKDIRNQIGMNDDDMFNFLRNELIKRGVLKQE